MKYSIGLYLFYFGKLPEWTHLLFETFKANDTIDFHLFTDCLVPCKAPDNLFIHKLNFENYVEYINKKLSVKMTSTSPIKLCDIRPFIAYLHDDVFSKYDFFGWVDLDLLLGDIRAFYTDDLLSRYDVFSTHAIRISGHLALLRNTRRNRNMYKKIYRWKEALANPEFVGIDEHGLTNAFLLTVFDKINYKFKLHIDNFVTRFFANRKKRKLYMVEQYTTPFVTIPWIDGSVNSAQPDTWYYKNGQITNDRDGKRNFIYIHFMNFKSDKWRHDNTPAPWKNLKQICLATAADMKNGIIIDKSGIKPMQIDK